MNALIDTLAAHVLQSPIKGYVLDEFEKTYAFFEEADTEDRERVLSYFEDIMDAVGMESSDGTLNRLLYGD